MEELLTQFRKKLVLRQLSEGTIDDYVKSFRLYAIDQNINQLSDITTDNIETYVVKIIKEDHIGKTVAVITMLNNIVKVFDLEKIKVPSSPSYKRKMKHEPFTKEEIQKMINYVRKHPEEFKYSLRLITVLKFMARVGMRGIDFENLDREQFTTGANLTYHSSKKDKEVTIKMPEWLVKDLSEYFLYEPQKFNKVKAFNMTRDTLNYYLKKLVNKLGIVGKNRNAFPHLLRHSCITMLHNEGVNTKDIGEWVGHSNISDTEAYIHIETEQLTTRVLKQSKNLAFV